MALFGRVARVARQAISAGAARQLTACPVVAVPSFSAPVLARRRPIEWLGRPSDAVGKLRRKFDSQKRVPFFEFPVSIPA
jgi:hypothetical protein